LERLRQPNRNKAAEPASNRLIVEGSGDIAGVNVRPVAGGAGVRMGAAKFTSISSLTPMDIPISAPTDDTHPLNAGALLWIGLGPETSTGAANVSITPMDSMSAPLDHSHPLGAGALLWIGTGPGTSSPGIWPESTTPWAWQKAAEPRMNKRLRQNLKAVFLMFCAMVVILMGRSKAFRTRMQALNCTKMPLFGATHLFKFRRF